MQSRGLKQKKSSRARSVSHNDITHCRPLHKSLFVRSYANAFIASHATRCTARMNAPSPCVCSDSGKVAGGVLARDQTKVKAVLPSDWPHVACQGRLPAEEKFCWYQRQVTWSESSCHRVSSPSGPREHLSLSLNSIQSLIKAFFRGEGVVGMMRNSFWQLGSSLRRRQHPSKILSRRLVQNKTHTYRSGQKLPTLQTESGIQNWAFKWLHCLLDIILLLLLIFFFQHSSLQCTICPVSLTIHSPRGFQPLSTWSHGDWRIKDSHGPCKVLWAHSYLMLHANKEQQIPQASTQEGCERIGRTSFVGIWTTFIRKDTF